ncbi:MAG: type II secretion system F family protein [Candidatus Obscuribacterales bacterium]|nr:type II secretion system F family protein [Candidatus Obscuribacterales bacterium]
MPTASILTQINFLQYPEFALALLLGTLMFFCKKNPASKARRLPSWLTAPATAIVSSFPAKYVRWLLKLQIWSGFRSNTAFGGLSAIKVFIPFLIVLSGMILPLWAVLILAPISFFIPDLTLLFLSRRRRQRIKESLPQALDLMVLCVDAGLGLDSTLSKISTESSSLANELNDELILLSRDLLLGIERERAYLELYNRTGVEELRALGASLNQAAQLGISIAKILRAQSDFLRNKLSQKAEEKAARLPIYMAFPLWFCIMPALMVILLAPSFIIFFDSIKPLMLK